MIICFPIGLSGNFSAGIRMIISISGFSVEGFNSWIINNSEIRNRNNNFRVKFSSKKSAWTDHYYLHFKLSVCYSQFNIEIRFLDSRGNQSGIQLSLMCCSNHRNMRFHIFTVIAVIILKISFPRFALPVSLPILHIEFSVPRKYFSICSW